MKKFFNAIIRIFLELFHILVIFIAFLLNWGVDNFGGTKADEIVFTLSMATTGANSDYFKSAALKVILPTVIVYAVLIFARCYKSKFVYNLELVGTKSGKSKSLQVFPYAYHPAIIFLLCLLVFGVEFYRVDKQFKFVDYVKQLMQTSTFIEENYVDAASVEIQFPEEKQNLIWIYVESLESTLFDEESGGSFEVNYIPELYELAKTNVSFSQTDSGLTGAYVTNYSSWTIAGLVSESAGVPLKTVQQNTMNRYSEFLPGVTNLGDILEAAGYNNYFMCGSDINFAGRKNYYEQHGNYTIYDYYSAMEDGIIEDGYKVWWGMEDMYLFQYAKEKILEAAESGEPFNFQLLTVDSHFENGYICELCGSDYDDRYSNVWACTSVQVTAFVEWIMEQDFYENTTIIITGDHASMDVDFYMVDGEDIEERYVYNAIINANVDYDESVLTNRTFCTLDIFPTALASLGVTIEGNRLGLGTNLFSDVETLMEIYGTEYMDGELAKTSTFYNKNLLYPQD